MGNSDTTTFIPVNLAILTVSDTRTPDTDTSGDALANRALEAGHNITARQICKDDIYKIRALLSHWIADDTTQVVLITGGTGFTQRDSTPEAVLPLLDKTVDGFGELFRQISLAQIGTSTVQSRALAGLANRVLVCCVPGSTNACKTAWDEIIGPQIDSRTKPCNFVQHLKNVALSHCESRG